MSERSEIIDKIEDVTGWTIKPKRFRIITDTTEWMNIHRGHVIRLEGKDYVVRGNMNEPRFGIEDQPKMWVFSAIDLGTREEKIIKTVFNEEFTAHIGIFKIRCYRSQDKESKVLETVRGDMRFMQGETLYDEEGNNVRVIDYIKGKKFFHFVPNIEKAHLKYFEEDLPGILHKLYNAILAVQDLHKLGLNHGDIRNDHILIDAETGIYRWIDFDLNQDVMDFDLWSIGNVLSYAVAKGIKSYEIVMKSKEFTNEVKHSLTFDDSSAFYEYRIMNLRKLYPYIPDKLSEILQHFTIRPKAFYCCIEELIEDFAEMLEKEFPIDKEISAVS